MSGFKALNVESDDESDYEIDNTKEIQIEEALKLYQTALQAQSQGSKNLEATREAYDALFKSEIFKYPESQSRLDALDSVQIVPIDELQDAAGVEQIASGDADNSNLSQILHLSLKNRGQYHLDVLEDTIKRGHDWPSDSWISAQTSKAMQDFTDALDKDDDDVDLWRRAAKVGQGLDSRRLERYCLESALDGEEDETDDVLGMPNIETGQIKNELQELNVALEDRLSLLQSPKPCNTAKSSGGVSETYKLYPFLQRPSRQALLPEPSRVLLHPFEATWASVGHTIVQRLNAEQKGVISPPAGAAIGFEMPSERTNQHVSPPTLASENPQGEVALHEPSQSSPIKESPVPIAAEESVEAEMKDVEGSQSTNAAVTTTVNEGKTINLPSRKRSAEIAELPENAEGVRGRSKRLRARESISDANADGSRDSMSNTEEKYRPFVEADGWLFEVLDNIMQRFDVKTFEWGKGLRHLIVQPDESSNDSGDMPLIQALRDFYQSLQTWNQEKSELLVQKDIQEENSTETKNSGLIAFLDHSKPPTQDVETGPPPVGLDQFVETVNSKWLTSEEVALFWLQCLLHPEKCREAGTARILGQSSYESYLWPEALKQTVVQTILSVDEILFEGLQASIFDLDEQQPSASTPKAAASEDANATQNMIQTVFELHLDVQSRISNPASEVDQETRALQKDRLEKWSSLARDAINIRPERTQPQLSDESSLDPLETRHLWASCFHLEFCDGVPRDHLILYLQELKQLFFRNYPERCVSLPNNALMPEMSVKAAEREIFKLETMDFFLGIFNKNDQHPVDLIERLEPILLNADRVVRPNQQVDHGQNEVNGTGHEAFGNEFETPNGLNAVQSTSQILSDFVQRANTSLRLSLLRRLKDAYNEIEYPPKVVSINLQSLELVMVELKNKYSQNKEEDRNAELLKWLRECGENLKETLAIVEEHANSLECLDLEQIKSSIATVSDLFILLYPVAVFDDQCQLSQKGPLRMNPFRHYPLESLHVASITLHEMQLQTSMLLYRLIKEGMDQYSEQFPSPADDRLQYLRHIHYALGVRRLCKASDSLFLKFMKKELPKFSKHELDTDDDFAQIIYDMYDLHCFSSPYVKQDHGCEPDYLDRDTAVDMVDFVMEKAQKVNMKDLLKSDLGKSIDKLNTNLGVVKSSYATARNKKIYNAYMRSPVDRLELYRALRGVGDLSSVKVPQEEAIVASKGWYALKGSMELARCRAQKSKGQTQVEDLQVAIAFLVQDLEYSDERWETWYRLAEANDALIEEHVLWTADKVNTSRAELAQGERFSIHAYVMAVANAVRNADTSKDTITKVSELYSEFGLRIYSSARDPFQMQAFALADFPKKFYNDIGNRAGEFRIYQDRMFRDMKTSKALEFSGMLFRRAIGMNPCYWFNHYMLAKTLWKLHAIAGREKGPERESAFLDEMFKALMNAVDRLPERKDPNRQDPALEPIYKIASIAHKLVRNDKYTPEKAAAQVKEMLQKQRQFDASKFPELQDYDSWDGYSLEVFRLIRSSDKVRWHHRLPFRVAQIIYEKNGKTSAAAKLTKNYLLEQHMYSPKTLSLQVWKPDHERAGRHWVYMSRYVVYLAQILDESDDVEAMQLLTRRVRKKAAEYFEHQKVWEEVCAAHLRLHRRHGDIPEHSEEVFKIMTQDEFAPRAEAIDVWAKETENSASNLRTVLQEVTELKKLNAGYVKTTAIDDLIADTYATIYTRIGPTLPLPAQPSTASPTAVPQEERKTSIMSLSHLMNVDGTASPRPTPPPGATTEQSTKPRIKLVSRRETLKRAAEAVAPKLPESGAVTKGKPGPKAIDRIAKEAAADSKDASSVDDGVATAPSSAPGSVHDSADDESELSEPDAEMEDLLEQEQPVFPNLQADGDDGDEETGQEEEKSDSEAEGDGGGAEEQIQREADTEHEQGDQPMDS